MTYKPGDHVVMTHPFFDAHVVAEVVTVSGKMGTFLGYTSRGKSDEAPVRRKLDSILGRIAPGQTPQEESDRLNAARQVRQDLIEAAREQYLSKLAIIVADD